MRIPNTICVEYLKLYELPANVFVRNEILRSEDLLWDYNLITSLRELCLQAIALYWEKYPLYKEVPLREDRSSLVDFLPSILPLELTISRLHNDIFWQRSYTSRWPNSRPRLIFLPKSQAICSVIHEKISEDELSENITEEESRSNSDRSVASSSTKSSDIVDKIIKKYVGPTLTVKSWKINFLERYLQEELERMKPDIFNPEYIKELTDLLGPYIFNLKINELKASSDENNLDHISLHSLLARLPNLKEFSVCFAEEHAAENFRWRLREVTENDCSMLGNGVSKSKIEELRILRSNINCSNVKLILRPICNHETLKILDLSHCKIADEGALALAEMFLESPVLETAILVNNKIGPKGAEGLGYYLCLPESRLRELNLKLNPLKVDGGKYISTALARGAKTLETLSLSSCGLTNENMYLGNALALNTTLQKLDLSNNHLGEEFGDKFLQGLAQNFTLKNADLRMCGISSKIVQEMELYLKGNLTKKRSSTGKSYSESNYS